jgi:hypothetical protein
MEQKLTAQIAARYLGCKIKCAPYGGQPTRFEYGKMVGLNETHLHCRLGNWVSPHDMPIGSCQLVLRPISELTDEECIELVKLANTPPNLPEDWSDIISSLIIDQISRADNEIEINFSLCCFEGCLTVGFHAMTFDLTDDDDEYCPIWKDHRLSDYLRSISIDIDGLIEAGIAVVDKK